MSLASNTRQMLRSTFTGTTLSPLSSLSSLPSSLFLFSSSFSTQPQPLNRARRGLYGGKRVLTGNNVSFSKRRTKRRWNPNVQTKRYQSDLLQEQLKIKVTTTVMRTIKKYGSLDNYILNMSDKKLYDSDFGLRLKRRLIKAAAAQQTNSDFTAEVTAEVGEEFTGEEEEVIEVLKEKL
jgi:large subunit ribosomal protein L28